MKKLYQRLFLYLIISFSFLLYIRSCLYSKSFIMSNFKLVTVKKHYVSMCKYLIHLFILELRHSLAELRVTQVLTSLRSKCGHDLLELQKQEKTASVL